MRADTVQHTTPLGGDVRSPVAGWHTDNDEARSRASGSRHQHQLYVERFVYAISCCLHYLLFNRVEILLMRGNGAISLISANTEDKNAAPNVGHGTEVVG